MARKVQMWEDSNGILYTTKAGADRADMLASANEKLCDDQDFYYGGLRGVECIGDLKDFLERNEDWILALMRWRSK